MPDIGDHEVRTPVAVQPIDLLPGLLAGRPRQHECGRSTRRTAHDDLDVDVVTDHEDLSDVDAGACGDRLHRDHGGLADDGGGCLGDVRDPGTDRAREGHTARALAEVVPGHGRGQERCPGPDGVAGSLDLPAVDLLIMGDQNDVDPVRVGSDDRDPVAQQRPVRARTAQHEHASSRMVLFQVGGGDQRGREEVAVVDGQAVLAELVGVVLRRVGGAVGVDDHADAALPQPADHLVRARHQISAGATGPFRNDERAVHVQHHRPDGGEPFRAWDHCPR